MRILIVDDEKNIRRAMSIALESMEHEVTCASNSATALAQIRSSNGLMPDTIASLPAELTRRKESERGGPLSTLSACTDLNPIDPSPRATI